jgi:hypothetical protein
MTEQPHRDEPEQPNDPFDEQWPSRWEKHMREGELLFLGLAELPTVDDAGRALERLSQLDLRRIVLERLYVWQVAHDPEGRQGFPGDAWLHPLADS